MGFAASIQPGKEQLMRCPMCDSEASGAFCAQCGAKLPAADSADKTRSGGSTTTVPPISADLPGGRKVSDVPEVVLWEGSYSPKAMIGPFVACIVVTLALIVAAVLFAAFWIVPLGLAVVLWLIVVAKLAINRLGVSYKLTNQMFYHREGLLTRTTNRIELIEVHDVTYQQGLIERVVNVGKIVITSNDRTHPNLKLPGIEDVEGVAKKIDDARRAEQVRRGRRIESIGMHGV
jgi:membrane protein YdbS with pleckstrin-like domain